MQDRQTGQSLMDTDMTVQLLQPGQELTQFMVVDCCWWTAGGTCKTCQDSHRQGQQAVYMWVTIFGPQNW